MEKISAGDPGSQSADVVADNLERLKGIFPAAFTEGRVDFGVLRQLLGDAVDDGEEKYGLNWHGKHRARQLALTPSTGTLRPCPADSVDWDTTRNLMIEGDNLEVLKLLQKSYAGKVKLIYIDPPYNTGKDFIYPDNYRDNIQNYLELTGQTDDANQKLSSNVESSGRFHTDWLNMMYPRLKLARNLLRTDGLIFVSIDQIELSNLRQIMDEIFGSENFFAILTRRAMHTVRNSSKDFNLHADYLLAYGRHKAWFGERKCRYIRAPADKSGNYGRDDGDGRGAYKLDPLHARNYYRPYQHRFSNGVVWSAPEGSYPRYSQATLAKMEQEGRIHFGAGQPMAKRYLRDVQKGSPPNTILNPKDVGYNFDGTKDLDSVLGKDKIFPQPKPTKLIHYLITLCNDPKAVVLDFFSGSGTAAQAVWEMNIEDQGERRFILVQLPEPLLGENSSGASQFCEGIGKPHTIAELTKERLRRAARKIKDENRELRGGGDLGFRVFKLDTSNIRAWDPEPDDLEDALLSSLDHMKAGRTEQDILYELLLKLGLDLCAPIDTQTIAGKSVHSVGAGTLMACLDEAISRDDVEPLALGIADWHDALAPAGESIVVFRDSTFADDVAKTNLAETLKQRGLGDVRSL